MTYLFSILRLLLTRSATVTPPIATRTTSIMTMIFHVLNDASASIRWLLPSDERSVKMKGVALFVVGSTVEVVVAFGDAVVAFVNK